MINSSYSWWIKAEHNEAYLYQKILKYEAFHIVYLVLFQTPQPV